MSDNETDGDYYATLRIQQGRLKAAIAKSGFSVRSLAEKTKVHPTSIHNLLNFRVSPIKRKTGLWHRNVIELCKVLKCGPSELFPEHLQCVVMSNKRIAYLDADRLSGVMRPQLNPAQACVREDIKSELSGVLESLPEEQRMVLDRRFWDCDTLEAIAADIGKTRERVRSIEGAALRKLRHPTRLSRLAGMLDAYGPTDGGSL